MILPDLQNIILFIFAALTLIIIPGPAVLYIMSKSIEQGSKAGLVSVCGIGIGGLVHVFAAALGISAILVASATAFMMVKFLGAFYLVYLGLNKLLVQKKNLKDGINSHQSSYKKIFLEGVVVNVFNPKTAIFFLAFLPQFINVERGGVPFQILFLGLIFIVLAVISDALYALLAGRLFTSVNKYRDNSILYEKTMGVIYIMLGLLTLGANSSVKNK